MSLTDALRDELAAVAPGSSDEAAAELAALLRFSGGLHRRGGGDHPWTWVSTVRSTAARRADRQIAALFGVRCDLRARRLTAPRPMLLVEVVVPGSLLEPLGLLLADGTVAQDIADGCSSGSRAWAYVRGAALAGVRLAAPGRPHCEVPAPSEPLAVALAAVLCDLDVSAAAVPHTRGRWRVVIKSRPAIATLLAGTAATVTCLRWQEESTRHHVRGAAARGVNADRANAQRSVQAATRQVAVVADAMAGPGADDLPTALRATALARLANPTASLGELASLLDVSRATVSRRLRRVAELHDGGDRQ